MRKTILQIVIISSILFTCQQSFAQLSSSNIDSLMREGLTKLKVAGAAIAVVKDGKVIHLKGYGV
ncbi:MAG: serine hydrolase, partial [Pedobacter sp.]